MIAAGKLRWPGLGALVCLAGLGMSAPALAAGAPMACTVPAGFFKAEPLLPRTAKALAQGGRVMIVAIGSASTQGNAAGSQELTWPGRLSAALAKRYPAAQLTVVNLGSGRLTAVTLAARLERDVLDLHPSLVILEVGTTDAVRNTDIDDFRDAVQSSIEQLQADGP